MTFLQEVSDRVDKEEEESVVLLHLERGAHQVRYCPVYPAHGEGSPPGTVMSSVSGQPGSPGAVLSCVPCRPISWVHQVQYGPVYPAV